MGRCVTWGGHRVPITLSLSAPTYCGEFTLRHVRAKWCKLIWCHLLMPGFFIAVDTHMWGDAQTPSRPLCPSPLDGRQQAPSFHQLLSEQSLCLCLVFLNCLSLIEPQILISTCYCLIWAMSLYFWRLNTLRPLNYLRVLHVKFAALELGLNGLSKF